MTCDIPFPLRRLYSGITYPFYIGGPSKIGTCNVAFDWLEWISIVKILLSKCFFLKMKFIAFWLGRWRVSNYLESPRMLVEVWQRKRNFELGRRNLSEEALNELKQNRKWLMEYGWWSHLWRMVVNGTAREVHQVSPHKLIKQLQSNHHTCFIILLHHFF